MTRETIFWLRVRKTNTCWEWLGSRTKKGAGHGAFWDGARTVLAHRYAYALLVGPIPQGLQLDHLCRNRGCVNPAHLEPVTLRENVRRGLKGVLHTHCKQGHPMTPDNTLVHNTKRGVTRKCRTCQNLANRKYRAKKGT